jgi:hypothetical protein
VPLAASSGVTDSAILIDDKTQVLHGSRENPILHRNMNPNRVHADDGVTTMTNASMTFGRPQRLAIPRGSVWAASAMAFLIDGLRRLDRWQLSLNRDEPRSVEDVLAWAARIEPTEPSFAADLRAAALRADIEPRPAPRN